ncbi:unnamed protein product [Aphanomyces euteiches]
MNSQTSFSELLLGTNNQLDEQYGMGSESLDQMTQDVLKESHGTLKRKPSHSFQKQRSQVLEYSPSVDHLFDDYKTDNNGADGTTTFVTPHGEEQREGLGLDLDSLVPSSTSPAQVVDVDPIPFKTDKVEPSNNQIESIPDLLEIAIPQPPSSNPSLNRRGHTHRHSVELTGLSQQFDASLQTSSPVMGYPTSPAHMGGYSSSPVMNPMMSMMPPGSPVANPMSHPMMMQPPSSPVHNRMMMPPQPSSPIQNGMAIPMPIPISFYNQSPVNQMNQMYSYESMLAMNSPPMSMSEQFGQFQLSQPNSPSSSDASEKKENPAVREKREYKCRQCGQPKSGHICTSIKSMMDSAVQNETTATNTSEWRILRVKTKWVS